MLLDTYFYHLPRAIPSHTCEDIIQFGKSLNPKQARTMSTKDKLSDEEKKQEINDIRKKNDKLEGKNIELEEYRRNKVMEEKPEKKINWNLVRM